MTTIIFILGLFFSIQYLEALAIDVTHNTDENQGSRKTGLLIALICWGALFYLLNN